MLLSLAFLAPSLVKAIAENRMPRGIGLTRMTDLPSEWPMQWSALGLADEAPVTPASDRERVGAPNSSPS